MLGHSYDHLLTSAIVRSFPDEQLAVNRGVVVPFRLLLGGHPGRITLLHYGCCDRGADLGAKIVVRLRECCAWREVLAGRMCVWE